MKAFRMDLKLVILKYLYILNKSFLWLNYFSNEVMLSEISKYICSYDLNTIGFDYLYMFTNPNVMYNLNTF